MTRRTHIVRRADLLDPPSSAWPKGPGLRTVLLAVTLSAMPGALAALDADLTPPLLAPAVISPLGPEQYGSGLGGTMAARGTGVNGWYVNRDGVTLTLSATDNVGVAKF